jgi:hypothetical protein
MSHKRKGQLATSGEWAKHLRPFQRRLYWGRERSAERSEILREVKQAAEIKLPKLPEASSLLRVKKLTP